jgi:hypothetical protein
MSITDVALHLPRRRLRTRAHTDRRTGPRARIALARNLEHVIEDARAPRSYLSARVPVRGAEVVAARREIEALVERLRELDRPVEAEGMRLAHDLLCEGDGPLYQWAEPGTLRRRLRVILEGM